MKKWEDIRKKSISDKMKEKLGLCLKCHRPEAQHVWLSRLELEMWRPEPGEVKTWCEKQPAQRHSSRPDAVVGSRFKIYSEAKAPIDPCDSAFMEDISS